MNLTAISEKSEVDKTPVPEELLKMYVMIPDIIYLIKTEKCNFYIKDNGLVCFSTEGNCNEYKNRYNTEYKTIQYTFNDARDVAKVLSNRSSVDCLILLDNPENPVKHYVK